MNSHDELELLRTMADRSRQSERYPGALPPVLPFELPMPPGARVIGSTARRWQLNPSRTGPDEPPEPPSFANLDVVYLDAPGTPDDLRAFFDSAFAPPVWLRALHLGSPDPTAERNAPSTIMYRQEDDPHVMCSLRPREGGRTLVELNISWKEGLPARGYEPEARDVLPTLVENDDVSVMFQIESGYRINVVFIEGRVRSQRPISAVHEWAAVQLADAGLVERDRSHGEGAAWSWWVTTGEPTFDVWLFIAPARVPSEYLLFFHVEGDNPEAD